MAKKQFKAESKRLLDLMINSIYTNKEIFLRELISNASDALDKRHFLSLTDKEHATQFVPEISIKADKEQRTLTVSDTGVGMNKEELEDNLGTIARSGSAKFMEENKDSKDLDIIGQFGVGFYSAFMVAKKITVNSLRLGETQGYLWTSEGADGYTVTESDKDSVGTTVTLYLREDTEDVKYSEYLDSFRIKTLVRKYSDYVRYPIHMDMEKSRLKEGTENEYETVTENETLNSMIPLWKRNKKDISKEDYNGFYASKFYDHTEPMKVLHYSVEGNLSYTALLYIPGEPPFDYYSPDYKGSLQLYSKGVLIMEDAKNILPDYFKFVRGIVDSDDISLNISREMLQEDAQLKAIAQSVTKKVKNALAEMLAKDREQYETFFKNFGLTLKYGIYNDYGIHKKDLEDLILFESSKDGKYVTLKEYTERMKEGQKEIYYAAGESKEKIEVLPQLEKVRSKGYEVLYFTDRVDEFMIRMMNDYQDHTFKSISQGDLDLDTEEEKKEKEELKKTNEPMLNAMKDALAGKVSDVRISTHLTDYPVCLTADEGISFEMEKTLRNVPNGGMGLKAAKILEVNPNHPLFETLKKIYEKDPSKLGKYAGLLYSQALLIEGFPIEDAVEYSRLVCEMMVDAAKE